VVAEELVFAEDFTEVVVEDVDDELHAAKTSEKTRRLASPMSFRRMVGTSLRVCRRWYDLAACPSRMSRQTHLPLPN
jgi:hypothetical protein